MLIIANLNRFLHLNYLKCFTWFTIIFTSSLPFHSSAQNSGDGCLINGLVYTEFLDVGYPYGPFNGQKRIYKNPGMTLSINNNGYNGSKPNNENYVCGAINDYYSPIAKHEYNIISYSACVTESSLGSTVNGDGAYVTWNINDPLYCSPPSTPLPLDDYLPLFLLLTGGLGALYVRGILNLKT